MSEKENDGIISDTVKNAAETQIIKRTPYQAMAAANKITTRRTIYAAGIGLLPFPIVDVALVLGIQVTMIRDIARIYNISFEKQLVKSSITTLVGNLGVMGGLKLIPGIGSLLGSFVVSTSAAAATFALGKVFTQHFSQGGTLLNFDPSQSRKYFQEAYEEGTFLISDLEAKEVEENKLGKRWKNWLKGGAEQTTSNLVVVAQQKQKEQMTELSKLQEEIAALKKRAKEQKKQDLKTAKMDILRNDQKVETEAEMTLEA